MKILQNIHVRAALVLLAFVACIALIVLPTILFGPEGVVAVFVFLLAAVAVAWCYAIAFVSRRS